MRLRVNLLEFVKTRYSDMVNTIKETGELPGDELKDAVIAFVATLETPEED